VQLRDLAVRLRNPAEPRGAETDAGRRDWQGGGGGGGGSGEGSGGSGSSSSYSQVSIFLRFSLRC